MNGLGWAETLILIAVCLCGGKILFDGVFGDGPVEPPPAEGRLSFITGLIDRYLGRSRPADPRHWHPWTTFTTPRLIDGTRPIYHGQLWRRWNGQKWEYTADPETEDDYA